MDYKLTIDGREVEVIASPLEPGKPATWTIGEATTEVELRGNLPHGRTLLVDGRSVDLHTARTREGTWVWCEGRARLVRDARKATRAPGASAGGGAVRPMTPGVVVGVLVEPGQAVERGQGLVVVSAMKMESTLVAGHKGTVTAINTEVGAKVMPGDILVEIEAEEGSSDE